MEIPGLADDHQQSSSVYTSIHVTDYTIRILVVYTPKACIWQLNIPAAATAAVSAAKM